MEKYAVIIVETRDAEGNLIASKTIHKKEIITPKKMSDFGYAPAELQQIMKGVDNEWISASKQLAKS